MGQEIRQNIIRAASTDQKTVFAGISCTGLLGDVLDVRKGVDLFRGISSIGQQLLIVHHHGHIAIVRSKIDFVVDYTDLGGSGDNIIIKTVSQLAQIGQNTVLGKLCHPGAIHHTQIIGAHVIHSIQRNACMQVIKRHEHHFDIYVVLLFKSRQTCLQGFAIGSAPQDQCHLCGLT